MTGRPDTAPPASRLVATTTRLDADVDLSAVAGEDGVLFEQRGTGLAGRGQAVRVPLPVGPRRLAAAAGVVADVLATIAVHDEVGLPGCGPVAFVALPFGDATPASALVPAVVVGRADDGTRWMTTVGRPEDPPPRPQPVAPAHDRPHPPSRYRVAPGRPPSDWCHAVAAAVAALGPRGVAKVVLAREVVVEADAPLSVGAVLARLRAAYPSAMLYAVDGMVGASPELLVSRVGDVVRSHPMAGTAPRSGDPATDARGAASLLASAKDRAEHQITIDMVLDTVLPFCSYVDSEPEPQVVSLANAHHLASLVEGRLSAPPAPVLDLVAALHPTPAVCGWPRAEALALIGELEGLDRGRYTGPVGWVDARGNGRLAVAIRGAELEGRRARLLAGGGIVADSDPAAELAETRLKLEAMLAAVIRP
ncbi:MAG: isochorismate synthase [Acidimicrobiales bacterium]